MNVLLYTEDKKLISLEFDTHLSIKPYSTFKTISDKRLLEVDTDAEHFLWLIDEHGVYYDLSGVDKWNGEAIENFVSRAVRFQTMRFRLVNSETREAITAANPEFSEDNLKIFEEFNLDYAERYNSVNLKDDWKENYKD